MTDTAPAMAEFSTADVQKLTPEGRAVAEKAFARAGFTKEQIAAKFSAASPAPALDPGRPPISDGPSPDALAQHYQNLAKHWTGDPGALKAAAERDGIHLDGLAAQKQVTADAIAAEQNANIIAQLSAPAEYRLTYLNAGEMSPPELVAFNGKVTAAFKAADIPVSLAQGLLDAIVRTAGTYKGLKPEAHALTHAEEGARFKKLSGGAENVRLATVGFNALPQAFREMIDGPKGFHSAASQLALANVGRAIEEKARRTKK